MDAAPGLTGLYARAALGALPGAGLLPFLGGRADDVPDTVLELEDVAVDPGHVAAYAHVCGYAVRATLPPTYPHVLAFPLHLKLMTDRRFPFPVLGLVHVANRIAVHRPLRMDERLAVRVSATPLAPHPKGRQFDLVTEVRAGGELVWESASTTLRRGGGSGERSEREAEPELTPEAHWRVAADVGRRYAAVSGDRNPIHLHDLTAKALGFPRAIAHGMWTKARAVAALENRLPDAFTVEVRFAKPLLLPGRVVFATDRDRFSVRAERDGTPHLHGETRSTT